MRSTFLFLAIIFLSLPLSAQFPKDLFVEKIAEGLTAPTEITNAGDERLFVCQREGIIKILNAEDDIVEQAFLDITDRVMDFGELGLLSLAFHPDYFDNGLFYVSYANSDRNLIIAEYSVSQDDPNVADPNSERVLLTVEHEFYAHLGACLRFGPDGYLYISIGDGEVLDGPQKVTEFFGKILRIDVDNGDPYAIPEDNPLVNEVGAKKEIWAIGLRNPWKFCFDEETGDMIIADVGFKTTEEINFIEADESSLVNFGFPCFEGTTSFVGCLELDESEIEFPIASYDHEPWLNCSASVTGGYVYQDPVIDNFSSYIYGDYCTGRIYAMYQENGVNVSEIIFHNEYLLDDITTFGKDQSGELLVASLEDGAIFRLNFDCPIPDYDLTDASCSTSSDGCIELNIPSNQGIVGLELSDTLGNIIPEEDYCQLTSGIYNLAINNSNPTCSISFPIEISQFTPAIERTKASCSAINDATVSIGVYQNLPASHQFSLVSEDGELIDSTEYGSMYEGTYYLLSSDGNGGCVDSFFIYIDYISDFDMNIELINDTLFLMNEYESYQWYFSTFGFLSSEIISGATEQFHVPNLAGWYYVVAIDEEGCKNRRGKFFNGLTNVQTPSVFNNIKLYPNPTRDQMTLDLSEYERVEFLDYKILDLDGQMIIENTSIPSGAYLEYISTKDLSSGTYLLILYDGRETGVKKFVKI